jgi:phosphopantetheinyl transferase
VVLIILDEARRQQIEFNVSHAGAWTVIAAEQVPQVGTALELGVDIMPTKDRYSKS